MIRNRKSRRKNKTSKTKTLKSKTAKCHLFCKTDYMKHVNQELKDEKQTKRILDECKHIYCSDDCLKQYKQNSGFDDNNVFVENYKKRLNNNFLTDIDKRYNPNKYKDTLLKKGALSSCLSQNKNYYNVMHK